MSDFKPEEHCGFCGKNPDEVKQMINAETGVRICDSCVETCRDMLGAIRQGRGVYSFIVNNEDKS